MTEQDKPSRGELLSQEQMEKKAKRNRWMMGMLAGGLTIIIGIGLLLHQILFDQFNRIFFAICSIFGGGMITVGGIMVPDKSVYKDQADEILHRLNVQSGGRYISPKNIPMPALLAILGILFVVTGIVGLIRG
jgi:hypothetical protein